jgi:hypothetical protein
MSPLHYLIVNKSTIAYFWAVAMRSGPNNQMNSISKKRVTFLVVIVSIVLGMASFAPFSLPFSTRSKALIKPVLQWELVRNSQGNLASSTRNNLTGAMASYSITEFSRGDAVNFQLKANLQNGVVVKAGDTIGVLYSNEEQGKLIALQNELEVLKAELEFFNTGQKPEEVAMALNELRLAEQQLQNQQLLTRRSVLLYRDSVIAEQEYDLAVNALRMREIALQLAEARYAAITTGDKPEQIQLVKTRIQALERQLQQARDRISFFTLQAPFDGTIVLRQGFSSSDTLLQIHSIGPYIGVAPLLLSDRAFIQAGDAVEITQYGKHKGHAGKVVAFDNVAQLVNSQAVVFCTIAFDSTAQAPMAGELLEIKVRGEDLPARAYVSKVFTSP